EFLATTEGRTLISRRPKYILNEKMLDKPFYFDKFTRIDGVHAAKFRNRKKGRFTKENTKPLYHGSPQRSDCKPAEDYRNNPDTRVETHAPEPAVGREPAFWEKLLNGGSSLNIRYGGVVPGIGDLINPNSIDTHQWAVGPWIQGTRVGSHAPEPLFGRERAFWEELLNGGSSLNIRYGGVVPGIGDLINPNSIDTHQWAVGPWIQGWSQTLMILRCPSAGHQQFIVKYLSLGHLGVISVCAPPCIQGFTVH
ncbi:unnamed protein product, partial [Allacma fusca]